MSQSSQKWKKPTDIMRTRRQKKRQSAELAEQARRDSAKNETNTNDSDECRPDGDFGRKRRNPFEVSSPATRRAIESDRDLSTDKPDIADKREEKHALFSALNNAYQKLQDTARRRSSESTERGKKVQAVTPGSKSLQRGGGESNTQPVDVVPTPLAETDDPETNQRCGVIPLDWSLKVKLRIVSQNALISAPTSSAVKTRALSRFVHNEPIPDDNLEKDCVLRSLQQCCHYWVHPSLPGFPVFPRIVSQSSLRKQVSLDANSKPELQKALYSNWLESFGSVYQQLKKRHCPYFYLCCHQFTALFCGSTIGSRGHMTACLTPTTRGLREALRREDVEFTMPNQKASRTERSTTAKDRSARRNKVSPGQTGGDNGDDDDDEDDDDDDITTTDEGAALWLQDVGLDTKCFPTLEPSKVKIQREGYQQMDGRAESLVWCQAGAVQALYNFIINCRSCTAVTGPQAGIPPTILAPTAFVGAALKANKIQQSLAKVSTGTMTDDGHVVEISGPLLPHHVLNITALLQDIQDNSAIISLNTHEPTVPFNFIFTITTHTQPAPSASDRPSAVYSMHISTKQSPGGSVHTLNTSFSPTCPVTPGQQGVGKESSPYSVTGKFSVQQTAAKDRRSSSEALSASEVSSSSMLDMNIPEEDPDIVTEESPPSTPQYRKKTIGLVGRGVGRNPRRDSSSRSVEEIVTSSVTVSKDMGTPDSVNPRLVSTPEGPSGVGDSPAVDSQGSGYCGGVGVGAGMDSDIWDKGLHCSVRGHLSVPTTLPAGTAVREIQCQSGRVTWSD